MEPQIDYETELTLAVFRSAEQADDAIGRLQAMGIPAAAIAWMRLAPGRYPAADSSFGEGIKGVRDGALLGIPVGAVAGLGLAAVVPGAGPVVLAGLAAAGAAEGAVLGGFVGSIARARFDDDMARIIQLPGGEANVLLVVRTGGAAGIETVRAQAALRSAGAVGFLDPALHDDLELHRGHVVPMLTPSAGDRAEPSG